MELAGEQERNQLCGECLRSPPPYCLARSMVRYEPAVRKLIQRLKYAGDTSVIPGLAEIIGCCDLTVFADCQWILPVPLHIDRHRRRGLNQATILAHLFFPEQEQRVRPDWLIRVRNTPAQTTLGGIERRKNLAGAFQVRPGGLPESAVVCLVDDVFTTGTTVGECAGALQRHGGIEVKVLTLARAGAPPCHRWK
jgi:ComF family protein